MNVNQTLEWLKRIKKLPESYDAIDGAVIGMAALPRRLLILLVLLMSGCATIKNPLPESVSGSWEHSNIFYARLKLDNDGNGYLVNSFKTSETSVYAVGEYQSTQDGFSVKLTNINDEAESPEIVDLVLYDIGLLCIRDSETGDEDFCFMESADLDESKASATQVLDALTDKEHDAAELPSR